MKPSTLGLFIAATAFGASTIYLTLQLRGERAQADEIAGQMQALQARIAELERLKAEVLPLQPGEPGDDAELAVQSDAPPAPQPVGTQAEEDPPERVPRPNRTRPAQSEAARNVLRMNVRANNRGLYEDVEERLGLTKNQATRLIELLTDQQLARMDQFQREGAQGRGRGRLEPSQQDLAAISSVIGADRMPLFQDYQKTLPARQEVQTLTRQLEGADLALTEDQRDRLVSALTEERELVPAPVFDENTSREDYAAAMQEWQKDYRERSASRARGILDSKQYKSYDQYQQWVAEMQQQREARRNARRQGGNSGRAPGAGSPR
jgi:hypothetical protein